VATTFKVCRDLAHAVELYEAGLLTVDLDASLDRSSPLYGSAAKKFKTVGDLTAYYPRRSGGFRDGGGVWLFKDFGYLEED
jgi:hypothetical protein